jgi:D-alanine-D-alanine ligase
MMNIAIVAGGDSGEYVISIKSGQQVESRMDRTKFNPYLVEIRGSEWTCIRGEREYPLDKNDFSLTIGREKINFDAVFNAIHGTPGEDGKLQGYFDMIGIPYTSCDVTTSALTFNKSYCKKAVASEGILTARSLHLFKRNNTPASRVLQDLSLPVFIKPNNGGSSVGMSKVTLAAELEPALLKAFHEDDEVLAEEFIPGRELTCGVIRTGSGIIAFPVTEIISRKDYFDYEAKYSEGLSDEVVPADVPAEVAAGCQDISKILFEKLNCKGVVRFDYILKDSSFYFLEVNTVPGLTEQSIVPKMAKAYGWTMTELCTRLIEECLNH